jgi:thioredoxin 1
MPERRLPNSARFSTILFPSASKARPAHQTQVIRYSFGNRAVRLAVVAAYKSLFKERGGRMASDAILEVTDANFDQEVLKSEQPVLIDFWATWCGPCRALAPVVDEIAKSYQGKVKVAKMDVDRNTATPQRYGVRGIPTLLVFKGGQVQEQIVGFVPKETIEKALEKLA